MGKMQLKIRPKSESGASEVSPMKINNNRIDYFTKNVIQPIFG